MKLLDYLSIVFGIIGSFITGLFGGWTTGITTLLIFMVIDYLSGVILSLVFKKSSKTEKGGYKSKVGWEGICRKGITLLFVLISNRLDIELGTSYIRDAVVIAFATNELISIVENAGLMGVPIPKAITDCIEILKKKEGLNND